ncbi:hypothetical protein P7C70_g7854, partial [Phenoliferia sp. Uapishka_3]
MVPLEPPGPNPSTPFLAGRGRHISLSLSSGEESQNLLRRRSIGQTEPTEAAVHSRVSLSVSRSSNGQGTASEYALFNSFGSNSIELNRSPDGDSFTDENSEDFYARKDRDSQSSPSSAPAVSMSRFSLFPLYLLLVCILLTSTIFLTIPVLSQLGYGKPLRDPNTFEAGVEKLKGKKVVFVGDSLMRYKYIDVAYFLANGVTVSSVTNSTLPNSQNLINEKSYADWPAFYGASADLFRGYETCD